jgi:hypothetical protein
MKFSRACASFHGTIVMTSHNATLMPTAGAQIITRERVDFTLALAARRLSLPQRCKSKNAALLINGIKKRHSDLFSIAINCRQKRDKRIHSILDKGIANRYYLGPV